MRAIHGNFSVGIIISAFAERRYIYTIIIIIIIIRTHFYY
jgi:hypothetical protein